ncbi:hypothetical protein D5S18_05530 [Nocardia panacis]|uniref:Uncharacterized protein n=1 Tax=Nocardia panacis TaxID=2340916 RepID=A0A3A4L6G6_9NOCA|nr:hypothetical protein D5S18_05530 [Nocardia panacis]
MLFLCWKVVSLGEIRYVSRKRHKFRDFFRDEPQRGIDCLVPIAAILLLQHQDEVVDLACVLLFRQRDHIVGQCRDQGGQAAQLFQLRYVKYVGNQVKSAESFTQVEVVLQADCASTQGQEMVERRNAAKLAVGRFVHVGAQAELPVVCRAAAPGRGHAGVAP